MKRLLKHFKNTVFLFKSKLFEKTAERKERLKKQAKIKIKDLIANPERYGKNDVKKDDDYIKGERGGLYEIRISSRTGKPYKHYF